MLSKLIKWWNRPAWVAIVVKSLKRSNLLKYKCTGLCSAALTHMPRNERRRLFGAWPKFSGDYVFPVPEYTSAPQGAFDYAAHNGKMYDQTTEYGRNRLELAEFIRQELLKEYY